MDRVLGHKVSLSVLCVSSQSLSDLFKVLYPTVLVCADLPCRVVCCSVLNQSMRWKQRRRDGAVGTESEWRCERERQGKRESPGEVNGRNARWGSVNELHAGLGGYWRYCVEAAGVTVAVTDTKTTFHGRRHWLKAVARPLLADHTLSINNHFFFMVNSVWLALIALFLLCFLLWTKAAIFLVGMVLCHHGNERRFLILDYLFKICVFLEKLVNWRLERVITLYPSYFFHTKLFDIRSTSKYYHESVLYQFCSCHSVPRRNRKKGSIFHRIQTEFKLFVFLCDVQAITFGIHCTWQHLYTCTCMYFYCICSYTSLFRRYQ